MRTLSWTSPALLLAAVIGCTGNNGDPSAGGGGGGPSAKPTDRITGSGSSFIAPMFTKKWMAAYHKAKDLEVDYQSKGSGAGVTEMIEKKVKFACTDAPLNEDQTKKAVEAGSPPIHVPLVIGAVAIFYNLPPEVDKPVNFTGPVLADIFLGKIKKWNDPALVALNPGLPLPDLNIAPVVRADHSGTSYIFSDFLSKVSPEWKEKVGTGTLPKWPDSIKNREQKSDGVAGFVSQTKGALGYVELRYTRTNPNIKYGTVKNKAGKAVLPSLESTIAATEGIKENDIPEDLRFSMTDADGEGAYPICGATWAVSLIKQSPGDAAALKSFFTWALHEGQELTRSEEYAPVPKGLVERAQKKVDLIMGQ
jgi:phosphate transport system substrate-binding protein